MTTKLAGLIDALGRDYLNPELRELFLTTWKQPDILDQEQCDYQEFALTIACHQDDSSIAYNQIATWYQVAERPILAFWAYLYSLYLEPEQPAILAAALEYYQQDIAFANTQPKLPAPSCAVSIIMPTYNRGAIVRDSIASVIGQSVTDWELLVVNDGGDPAIEQTILALAEPRIRYLCIPHGGLSAALNAGLAAAKGRFLAYLDDDDIFYPDHLQLHLQSYAQNPSQMYSFSRCNMNFGSYEGPDFTSSSMRPAVKIDGYSREGLHRSPYIATLSVVHRRESLAQSGLFSTQLPWAMDWLQWIKMARAYPFHFIDQFTGEYRKNNYSMTTNLTYKMDFYCRKIVKNFFTSNYGGNLLLQAAQATGRPDISRMIRSRIATDNGYCRPELR